jgi:hypothetical protein
VEVVEVSNKYRYVEELISKKLVDKEEVLKDLIWVKLRCARDDWMRGDVESFSGRVKEIIFFLRMWRDTIDEVMNELLKVVQNTS